MAEKSYLWTTTAALGDGIAEYTRTDWQVIAQILGNSMKPNGVAASFRSGLVPTAVGLTTVRVASGGALVDGKPYDNTANVDIAIPAAVGAGNTRFDRVVARADWATQTVRLTRIAGVDAASPAVPAMNATSGTSYDIPIALVTVNTSGISLVQDNRLMAIVGTAEIADYSVTAIKLAIGQIQAAQVMPGGLTGANLANGTVGATQLGSNSVTTVKIADDQVTNAKMAPSSVGTTELIDNAVTTAKIGADQVTQAKMAPDAVAQETLMSSASKTLGHVGGNATNWNVAGGTMYGAAGSGTVSGASEASFPAGPPNIAVAVSFGAGFVGTPNVIIGKASSGTHWHVSALNITASGFDAYFERTATGAAEILIADWIAVGPK